MSQFRQLALDFGHRPALGRDDFWLSPCNEQAVAWLDRWPDWPSHCLALYGPAGCGKSHLLAVFQHDLGGEVRACPARDLTVSHVPHLLHGVRAAVIDDLEGLRDEEALFHLWNLARECRQHLLLAGREPPARLPIQLPDLRSRLAAVPAIGIGQPDESMLAAVLVKLFADRQLSVSADVVAYILSRIERSFAASRQLVARLDRISLAERRAITVPLVRSVLERDGQ